MSLSFLNVDWVIGLLFALSFIPGLAFVYRNLPGKPTAGFSPFNSVLLALAIGLDFAAITLNLFAG